MQDGLDTSLPVHFIFFDFSAVGVSNVYIHDMYFYIPWSFQHKCLSKAITGSLCVNDWVFLWMTVGLQRCLLLICSPSLHSNIRAAVFQVRGNGPVVNVMYMTCAMRRWHANLIRFMNTCFCMTEKVLRDYICSPWHESSQCRLKTWLKFHS